MTFQLVIVLNLTNDFRKKHDVEFLLTVFMTDLYNRNGLEHKNKIAETNQRQAGYNSLNVIYQSPPGNINNSIQFNSYMVLLHRNLILIPLT